MSPPAQAPEQRCYGLHLSDIKTGACARQRAEVVVVVTGVREATGMSMELSNYLVSWVATYLGDLQPTYIGVIIYLLSSMDILVP